MSEKENPFQQNFDKLKDGFNTMKDDLHTPVNFRFDSQIPNQASNFMKKINDPENIHTLQQSVLKLEDDKKFLQTSLIDQKNDFNNERINTFLRIIRHSNKALGMLLGGAGILQLITFSLVNPESIIMPIFIIFFAVITVAGDFELKWVLSNFAFIGNFIGRGLFYLFLGSTLTLRLDFQQGST